MRALLFAIALLAPAPAFALSCMAPSVERSFAQFQEAEEVYIVVHGKLNFDPELLPEGMTQDPLPPELTLVSAHLKGASLTTDGFVRSYDQPVTLEVSCAGPWCGNAKTGEDIVAFVRKDEDGYALAIRPCGGAVFGSPEPEMLQQLHTCFVGKECTAR
ncbi:hypothetical protein Z945_498 [Sulfitobacter noctilucae]|uniref:hypothetical protein n=1 Tax=Sulfitobacter noctilucae TaxID=1342302 RepID=UPI00055D11B2|nr:hypothetical protein [Sulfitobacter noctilucae]KIN65455.1 hypothetical protein Z945_498 [Sulfitobacter noctilucae]